MRGFLLLALLGISSMCFGQVPMANDQHTSDQDILDCITWLQMTPIEVDRDIRYTANAFLLQWLSKSPEVNVELRSDLVDMAEKNPDLLVIYMSGWAAYSLKNGEPYPSVEAHIQGIEAVRDFYRKNRDGLNRDKHLEKLIKKESKGKVHDVLRKNWE